MELVEPSVMLGLLNAFLGVSAAIFYGGSNLGFGILAILGVCMVQMCANLVDDYFDYKSGIDKETVKTRFSGGSAIVAKKKISAKSLLFMAAICATAAIAIGAYLSFYIPLIIPLVIVGGVITLFYANYITRIPFIAELSVMAAFLMAGIGSFIVTMGSPWKLPNALPVLIVGGLFGGVSLLVNEMPDRKIDKKFGRKSMSTLFLSDKKISRVFLFSQALVYLLAVYAVSSGFAPLRMLLLLFMLPVSYKVYIGIRDYKSAHSYERTMKLWALSSMVFLLVLALSYITAIVNL